MTDNTPIVNKWLRLAIDTTYEMNALLKEHKILQWDFIGSAMYVEDAKDLDVLVLVPGTGFLEPTEDGVLSPRWMFGTDFILCGDYDHVNDTWGAIRRADGLNLIVTTDRQFFNGMYRASEVCRALKLTDKRQRVLVHRIVRDGCDAEAAAMAAAQATV